MQTSAEPGRQPKLDTPGLRDVPENGVSDSEKENVPAQSAVSGLEAQQEQKLDEKHPQLQEKEGGNLVDHLDVATVLRVSQAVSGEITLDKLVEALLRTAIEQAGAERALLILPRGSELWIQAEAKIHGDSVTVRLKEAPISAAELPEAIVRFAARTQEAVILDDASVQNPYSTDTYIREQRLRSVLCLPLVKQSTLVALLYLENNIGPNIFAPAKIAILRVIASAAAISLDNSRLYHELQEREGKIRRLVDANIIGVLISNSEGQIIESNDAFLKMVGYSREELVLGRMCWRNMTPAEWKVASEQGVAQVKGTGVCKVFEKEYYRKDGSRVPVLVGAAKFEENSIVAFAIDLTERKRAEEALQSISTDSLESKARLEEAQRITHVGYWERDLVTGRITWSDETYRIYGLQPQELLMDLNALRQKVHPEDWGLVSRALDEALAGGPRYNVEYRVLRPTGELRIVHSEGDVKRDASGRPHQIFGIVQDITDRKHAEEALKRSEFYLAEGQRLSHAGSWSFKPDLTCDYWSRELYEILGFDPRNGIPTVPNYLARVHPGDRKNVEATIKRMIAAGEGCDLKMRIIRPDSVQRVIRCVAMSVRENGVVTRFVGTLMDITEQEELTQELRRREAYLAEAQRLSQTGSFGWDVVTNKETWSDETYRICGYDLSVKPSFQLILDRVHADDIRLWQEAFGRAAEGKEVNFEHRLVMPNGLVKYLHVVAYGAQKDGRFVELIGTMRDITDRKRVEEIVRRSEAYLTEGQRLSQTGSSAHNPATGKIHYWSQETYRIWGVDPKQPPPDGSMIVKMIHPEDRDRAREEYLDAVREGKDYDQEYRVVRSDGTVRYIHVVGHPVFSAGGELIEYVSTHVDITERKRAEDGLRNSEQKYRHLVDTTPAFVHTALPNGDLDFFNRGWLEYLGLSITDLVGWRWTAAIHPEDVEELLNQWRASLESGQPFVNESRVRRADGEYRWFLHRKQPQRNEAGEIVKWYGSSIEIEERKIAEEAIRRGEAFLAEGQRLSSTGSWGWNSATGKLTWSQEHFRILGLDPKKTNASLDIFWERVHPDDRIGMRRAFESAIRGKRDFEQEFRIIRPDWSIRHLHSVAHVVLNKANELVEFIGSTMDITERKRAEDRAESQREAIRLALNAFVEKLDVDRFLGDVIVELNKQFHAKSWELWLFDEIFSELSLHLSSYSVDSRNRGTGDKNTRRTEELMSIWASKNIARAPQVFELEVQGSILDPQYSKLLNAKGVKTLLIVPLALGEQNLGFLELHFQSSTQFTSDDLELAQTLVNYATLALQLNRLTHRAGQLAVTEERNRLARDIHDTLAQAFAGIVLHSEALGTSIGASKKRGVKSLSSIQKLARSGLDEARRSVQALRPKALEGSTLSEALKQAAKRLAEGGKLSCHFKQRGTGRSFSIEAQNELFRITQEALTNITKHAKATSVCINLTFTARQAVLTIRDDGVGLVAAASTEPRHGYGLSTMRERAQRIGGKLEIESPKGGGTSIRIRVPQANTGKL